MTQPAPPVDDPALTGLAFEQLAQLVEGQSADELYRQAAVFDGALLRFHDVLAEILRESRQMSELWDGRIAEAFDSFAAELTGGVDKIIQTMESPGHGVLLRRAGDALTAAQQRFRELRAQPGHEADNRPALQIVHDLSVAYQEAGGAMTATPDFVRRLPGAAADQQGTTGGGAAAGSAAPALAATGPSAGAATAGPVHGDWAVPGAGPALGFGAMAAGAAAPMPGGTTAGGAGGGVGGHGSRGAGVLGRSAPVTAQAAHQPAGRADGGAGPVAGGFFGALGRGKRDEKREREKRALAVPQEGSTAPQDAVEDARQRAFGVSTTSAVPGAISARSIAPAEAGTAIPAVATAGSPSQTGVPSVATASASTTGPVSPTASASTAAGAPVPATGLAQPTTTAPIPGSSGSGGATAAPLSLPHGSSPSAGAAPLSAGPVSAGPAGGGTPAVPPVSRLDSALPGQPAPLPLGATTPATAGNGAPMMPMGMMGRGAGAETGSEGRDPDVPIGAGPEVWGPGAGAAVLGRRPRAEENPPDPELGDGMPEFSPGWLTPGRIDGRKS